MIKMLLTFVVLSVIIWIMLELWQKAGKRQKWKTLKTVGVASVCSGVAVLILSAIVILF